MRTLPRVALRDLLKDTNIISNKLVGEEREFAKNFVHRRVRLLIDANPSFEDPSRPGDLTPVATKGVAIALIKEMADVRTALTAIRVRVQADVKKGLHLPVDRTATARVLDQPPSGDAASMRERLILSVVYQATAWDIRFAEPANLDRLHLLCDRRLRLVERMLYEVGRNAARAWKAKPPAAGPWPDGLARAFEYPRVPRSVFQTTCQPTQTARTNTVRCWSRATVSRATRASAEPGPFGTSSSAGGSPASIPGSSIAHTPRQRAANPSFCTRSCV